VRVGRDGYKALDRHRDFATVFGTPEGKRVFSQVIDLCEGPIVNDDELGNHALLAARAFGRRIGARIAAWTTVEPAPEPVTKAQRPQR
jgi:hypothetical protein